MMANSHRPTPIAKQARCQKKHFPGLIRTRTGDAHIVQICMTFKRVVYQICQMLFLSPVALRERKGILQALLWAFNIMYLLRVPTPAGPCHCLQDLRMFQQCRCHQFVRQLQATAQLPHSRQLPSCSFGSAYTLNFFERSAVKIWIRHIIVRVFQKHLGHPVFAQL